MESLSLSLGGVSPEEAPARRHRVSIPGKDIWRTVRNGTVQNVEAALAYLKKSNGSVDARNSFGSSALHIAVWRNHLPIVRRLLAAGADPNARDGESGWSSLHRALHFGHIAVAGVLVEAGGSLVLEDTRGRTPIDLASGPLRQCLASSSKAGAKEVFSWGNGSNYQLGIGSTGILKVPGRLDALERLDVIAVAAAKFHTVALTASGEVYSWGFGRGGRLGHPDFDIHSGQVAVIYPRQIIYSFGYRGVSVIAVAKHHTVVATNGGEVYTWGSNREGRLGYPSVDTQPTPRRVGTLKARVVAVAAANKHSAVVTEAGEVYTWGCNTEGQLGYGTSNSVSNYIPRVVECLKGKKLVAVSAAKYHTIVLGAEGEVLTWGYKMVNPRRVSVVRYTKKAGGQQLKFHISERLHVVAISAGMTQSLALSEDGLVFYWFSADPALKCRQLLSLAGHQAVSVSSSKYQTAVATSAGDVYSWDGNCKADKNPVPVRVHGIKHATQLSVGEKHTVAVAALLIPDYPQRSGSGPSTANQSSSRTDEEVDFIPEMEDEELTADALGPKEGQLGLDVILKPVPSLKDLCQRVAAQSIVEPKNALQILEFADALGADILKGYCEEFIVRNLDYILTMAPVLFGHVRPSLLAQVEKALDTCSTQPWSHRRLPTPSATLPPVIESEEEENGYVGNAHARGLTRESNIFKVPSDKRSEGFLQQTTENGEDILKQVRAVRKKLQQIEALELKQAKGQSLDDQQLLKVQTKRELEQVLASLESGVLPELTKKSEKLYVKHSGEAFYASRSVEGNQKSSASGSKQRRRLDRTKSNGRGLDPSLQTGRTDAGMSGRPATETQDSSNAFTPYTKSLGRSRDVEVEPVSLPASSSGFVTISGFYSHAANMSEPELVGPAPSRTSSTILNPLSSPSAEVSSLPRKTTMASSVASPGQSRVPRKMTTLGKKVVKGGLSVFLSGALDEVHQPEAPLPPPVVPKVEGPAWGGARIPKESASLRAIQTQQKTEPKLVFSHALKIGSGSQATESSMPNSKQAGSTNVVSITKSAGKSPIVVENTETSNKRIPLSQFVRTSPIAVSQHGSSSNVHLENSWAASTSSAVAKSLRDIQLEQVQSKAHHRAPLPRGSPLQASPVGAVTFSVSASTSDHNLSPAETPNRWYKPDVSSPSNLRCIQIEEKAMKELRQLYKNVKLVRNERS